MLDEIRDEMHRAQKKYGPFTSTHEGLGVLIEEMAELQEAIRENDAEGIRHEAIQVSAVAARLAECCTYENRAFLERSGCA